MIVALHGFTGTPAMWHCIGLDGPALLGHGDACRATGNETFTGERERLTDLLPERPVHLVGYSLGARLSLAIALESPERVSALTIIGGSPGIQDAKDRALRVKADARWSERLRDMGIAAFVNEWQALPLWKSQESLPAKARESLRLGRLAHNPEQLARSMDALGTGAMPPMWNALSGIVVPVQIVTGALDHKYVEIARRMARLVPNAVLHSIPGAGHNPVLEKPQSVQSVINEVL
ncbi:MAG: alpha/beta fold hydrolase [Myxococcales bacterium]|nr:alpha/beta fold hydrolase [Myxococcales bacterium]